MAKEGRAESRSELRGRGGSPVNSADPASRQDQGRAAHATSDWQGQLKFFPPRYAKTFQSWHENIRDWCISRQLWWGHRIPVWYMFWEGPMANEPTDSQIVRLPLSFLSAEDNEHVVAQVVLERRDGRILIAFCVAPGHPEIEAKLSANGAAQDPDVLDTWFSSGLWPLSTLNWPDPSEISNLRSALNTWNPTTDLVTAREIITLWVSRMVMFNLYFENRLPFANVIVHAMIQDGEGRKMSKSLGNGVDPLDIISSHGADALRFTIATMATNTQDVRMPVVHDPATNKNTSPKFDI